MKLTVLLMTLAILNVSATGLSQTITFSGKEVPLEVVFSQVEKQTAYFFLYSDSVLAKAKRVTINVRKTSVEEFLRQVFAAQPLTYSVREKNVFVDVKVIPSPHWANVTSPPITIKGRVVNEKGEPVSASVIVQGSAKGTTTDAYGNFELSHVDEQAILLISGINIQSQTIAINGRIDITIQVVTKIAAEEEVVINAGYYSVKDRERTGNISKVNAATIEKQPVLNPLAALAGRVPGMQVTQNSGIPGSGFSVIIRGRNSIAAGNDPLYIIDGVPFSGQSLASYQVNRISPSFVGQGTVSPLNNINPADIESIEVLKDADATAIYGSRGANGVILITTKKGKAGKTLGTVMVNKAWSQVTTFVDMMNTREYLAMRKEAFANDGVTEYGLTDVDINGTWDQDRQTDWQKELYGNTAQQLNVQGSVSGGNEFTQFLFRGSYQNESTVFPGDGKYQRGSALVSVVHRSVDDKFHLQVSNAYSIDGNNVVSNNMVADALTLPPNAPSIYLSDGSLNWANSTWTNPLSYMASTYESTITLLTTNAVLSYQFVKGLSAKVNLGFNDYRIDEGNYTPSTVYDPAWQASSEYAYVFANNARRYSWIVEPQLGWESAVGKGTLQVLAGTTFSRESTEQLSTYASGFSSNSQIYDLSSASFQQLKYTPAQYSYQALFGRINYNFLQKYVLNLTARHDGSSRFGPGKQFATFGAVGAGWIFSDEKWIGRSLPWLSFGKLRASYGITGNDKIGDYEFLDTYATAPNPYQDNRGLVPQRLYNPVFGWENNKKLEAGLELGVAKDRVTSVISWYTNRSSNQLVGIPLPGMTGFTSIRSNLAATVQNSGWELELRGVIISKPKINWKSSFNISIPENKLIAYPGLEKSTYRNQYVIGQSLSINKLYNFTGFDPITGTYQFEDVNKDGIISSPYDRQQIRDLAPQFYGGFSNSVGWRKWQIDVFVQFVKQIKPGVLYYVYLPGMMLNQPAALLSRWPSGGQGSLSQIYTATNYALEDIQSKSKISTLAYQDASFVRLKNLSLSYLVHRDGSQKLGYRLFVQGQNILTWSRYDGGDPESVYGFVPPLTTLSCGIELQF